MRVMLYVAVGFNFIFKLLQFYDCLKIVQLTPIYKQSNLKALIRLVESQSIETYPRLCFSHMA